MFMETDETVMSLIMLVMKKTGHQSKTCSTPDHYPICVQQAILLEAIWTMPSPKRPHDK